MQKYKDMTLAALRQLKSDDLYRARAAFRNCTPAQLDEEYGQSGKTRAQIIADYEAHDAEVDKAIEWFFMVTK